MSRLVPRRTAPLVALLAAAPAAAYQARLVHSAPAGRCTLRLEADDEARTLRLRVSPEGAACAPSRDEVQAFLRDAFARTEPPRLEGTYRSLYLGRLVDLPWLAEALVAAAARDPGWDARRGRPVAGGANAWVAAALSRPDVTSQIEPALAAGGYRIRSASVEKVLVGDRRLRGGQGPPGKLPFDAMVWFRLERG